MKEKILKFLKSDFLFSAILNGAVLALCVLLASFSYDSTDDFYNSLFICQQHYYYNNEINYFYATLVGLLQFILPNFNCFVLLQVLLSCAAFTAITYVFCDKFGKKKALIFSLMINILLSLNHYADILSSKTAALLVAAGLLLLLNAIRNKRYNLPFWSGLMLSVLGSCLCFEYFIVGLVFFVAYFLGDMIAKRKYRQPFRKFFWYFRPFVLVLLFVVSLGAGTLYYSFCVNNSDEAASDYYKYSELNDTINKYPFPNYEDYKEEFRSCNVNSSNDYELLISGYYDKDKSLGIEAYEVLAEIQKREHPYSFVSDVSNIGYDIYNHIVRFDGIACILVFILLASAVFIIAHKKRFAFFPAFYLIAAFLNCLYVRFMLSSSAYNMYGVWLFALVFLIFSFDFEHFRDKGKGILVKYYKPAVYFWSAVIICMFAGYGFVYQSNLKPESGAKPGTLYTEINRHPERYYVLDPQSADELLERCDNCRHPLWGFKDDFADNIDGFGYFHRESQLSRHNLPSNIYEAVLTNNNVFVIDKNITFKKEKYFNEYYVEKGKTAHYNMVTEINGFNIYEVVTE